MTHSSPESPQQTADENSEETQSVRPDSKGGYARALGIVTAISLATGVGASVGERIMDAWDRDQANRQAKEILEDFRVEDIISCGDNPTITIGGPVKRNREIHPSVIVEFDVEPGPKAHVGVYKDHGDNFRDGTAELQWSPIDFESKHILQDRRDLPGNAYIANSLSQVVDSDDLAMKFGSIDPDETQRTSITVPLDPGYEGERTVQVKPHVTMLTMAGKDIRLDQDDKRYDIPGEPCVTFTVRVENGTALDARLVQDTAQN